MQVWQAPPASVCTWCIDPAQAAVRDDTPLVQTRGCGCRGRLGTTTMLSACGLAAACNRGRDGVMLVWRWRCIPLIVVLVGQVGVGCVDMVVFGAGKCRAGASARKAHHCPHHGSLLLKMSFRLFQHTWVGHVLGQMVSGLHPCCRPLCHGGAVSASHAQWDLGWGRHQSAASGRFVRAQTSLSGKKATMVRPGQETGRLRRPPCLLRRPPCLLP